MQCSSKDLYTNLAKAHSLFMDCLSVALRKAGCDVLQKLVPHVVLSSLGTCIQSELHLLLFDTAEVDHNWCRCMVFNFHKIAAGFGK